MLFILGREYAIPFSTICIGHMIVNCRTIYEDNSYLGEVLLIDTSYKPQPAVNDNVPVSKS
jgi:hypothetical protein